MTDIDTINNILAANEKRRAERRKFMKYAGGATVGLGAASLLAACNNNNDDNVFTPGPSAGPAPSPAPTPGAGVTDENILNFALNLEYLEAQFYSYAVYGTGLPANMLTGFGKQGTVTGGAKVPFQDPIVSAYAREIAQDEIAHVAYLRSVLGSSAVAMPAINISGDANGAFTAAARAAGVVPAAGTFDPYASDVNFLIGAFIFEDVGVTAYKGGAPLIKQANTLIGAAGILAAEAYHASLVRTVLYGMGLNTPAIIDNVNKISAARDSLDGTTAAQIAEDTTTGKSANDDQGITVNNMANIVPTNVNGLAYSRNTMQVHNIVYLTNKQASAGGFFPAGTNNQNPALTMSGNYA